MDHPKFVVQKSGSQFYFYLTADNGQIVLNSELYTRRGTVDEGVASVRSNAPLDNRYDRRRSRNGQSYFVLTAATGEVIGTSEMHTSEGAMAEAIESVKRSAPGAGVEG
jgi:uncharacterized protein YegP (UPF0339 family)